MSERILKAFCWRSGEICISDDVPEGALYLSTGPAILLAQTIDANSRHSYDDRFIVPGVHEAEDDEEALDAVFEFQKLLDSKLINVLASQSGERHVSSSTN